MAIHVDHGYSPETITIRQGESLRLRLIRHIANGCTDEIVFPLLNIRKPRPVGKPVTIDLRPKAPGVIEFFCGMKMLRGTLEVRPQI